VPDVPVAKFFNEILNGLGGLSGIEGLETMKYPFDGEHQFGKDPSVEERALTQGNRLL
jgi:hypothetical protein